METTAHFEHITQEIARRLNAATQEIVVAVAWFTDRDLFDALCRQAGRGLKVRLAVLHDRINVGAGRLNFGRLKDIGGEVFLIPAGDDRDPIMHHKFCVIDRTTVIIGPYNWSIRSPPATPRRLRNFRPTTSRNSNASIDRPARSVTRTRWTRPTATGRLDGNQ